MCHSCTVPLHQYESSTLTGDVEIANDLVTVAPVKKAASDVLKAGKCAAEG